MNEKITQCMKCGTELNPGNRYCGFCGSNINFQIRVSRNRFNISLKWILISALSIFCFEIIFATITGQIFIFLNGGTASDFETNIMVSSIGSLVGIFLGSFYLAYISPCITLKEPLTGISLEIIISQLLLIYLAGTFNFMFFTRTAFTLIIAFTGAIAGHSLQRRIRLSKINLLY